VLASSVDAKTGLMAVAAVNPDSSVAVAVLNMTAAPVSYQLTVANQAIDIEIPADALQTVVLN
jgi:O-glycosyl hydrolase